MTLSKYQRLAARTMNPALDADQTKLHALHEIASECGEIHGLFQKAYQGHPLSFDDLCLEIGDLLWEIAELCTAFEINLNEVAERNIEKLKERYPQGFDEERSVHRKEYTDDKI